MEKTKNGLELDEDMKLQRRTWAIERIGWVVMFLFLVAAALGYMGRGGLLINTKTAGGQQTGLEAEYEPYLRQETASKIEVTLYGQTRQLKLNKEFLERVRVEQVVPEPADSELTEAGITYTFNAGSTQPSVLLYFKPSDFGSLHTTISSGSSTLTLNQFVYP